MSAVADTPSVRARALRTRLADALRPYFKPTRSSVLPGWGRYVLMRPIPFEIWFRLRAARFLLTHHWRVAVGSTKSDASSTDHHARVVEHNFGNRWLFNRDRTERLMNVLRSLGSVSPESRVLVIGPRNEAEILLLSLYGFKLKHITGIDLLSYSPKILQMDMHAMRFADNVFDIVYVLYTLPYAYDLARACAEIVRVLRPGGIVAAGFQHTSSSPKNLRAPGSELRGGLDELIEHFAPHVDYVYWKEFAATGVDDGRATTIFSVRKS